MHDDNLKTSFKNITIREAFQQASSLLRAEALARGKDTGDTLNLAESHSPAANIAQDAERVSEWLLLHLLGIDRSQLFLRFDEPFPAHLSGKWQQMLERKLAGEPVQYMIGEQEFYGRPFYVNADVLIPRPETELLVEAIIARGRRIWPQEASMPQGESTLQGATPQEASMPQGDPQPQGAPTLADIGTGSGAIAITLALQMPEWSVHASDISAAALNIAKRNASRHQLSGRLHFHEGDLLDPFIAANIALDIIVSNPPYIPAAEIATLQREVQYEPRLALDGGDDGLVFYRRIISQLAALQHTPRLVGFEVGQGQAQQVAALLEASNRWETIEIITDLARIERHVIGYILK